MKIARRTRDVIGKINNSCGILTGFMCFILAAIILVDTGGRFLFNSPMNAVKDLAENMLPVLAFLCGGFLILHNAHVKVDLFYARYPEKVKIIFTLITQFLALIWIGVFSWQGYLLAIRAFDIGSKIAYAFPVPKYIFYVFVPIGGLLATLQIFVLCVDRIKLLRAGSVVKE
ncbi:MAG: TRAP transporter small permease [Chloroflexota bacterium]